MNTKTRTAPASTPAPAADITLAQLAEFDEIIDARSPSEFAEDPIPGAINLPVLDDTERILVGTTYKQLSAFDAKKLGAALVARNIADHLERHCPAKPKNWRPLVYCWRGGSRSGAMAHIFNQVGWRATQLPGGYKAYRRAVVAALETLPANYRYRVICGLTGSGKSRLLQALERQSAQVLDLEALAAHRGSVLGNLPDAPQPSQKMFDSLLWAALQRFDPARPVYVEAESKKIGNLRVPDALLDAMWQHGQCVRLEVEAAARVALLKEEYVHFLEQPEALNAKLSCLTGLYGHEVIARWHAMAQAGQWDELVGELLEKHYDPAYSKSMLRHYAHYTQGLLLHGSDLGEAGMAALARNILEWAENPA